MEFCLVNSSVDVQFFFELALLALSGTRGKFSCSSYAHSLPLI